MISIFKILYFLYDDNSFYIRLMMDICFVDFGLFYILFCFFYFRVVNIIIGMFMNLIIWGQRIVWK